MTKLQEKIIPTNVFGESNSNNLSTSDEKIIIFHQLMTKHGFSYGNEIQKRLARKWVNELY